MAPTDLQTTWFVLIGVVWTLYLVLGGADLGVGMLLRRADRKTALRSIGPTWAANDVWLIVAVAATLGAVPGWYSAWTSGLYLPLVVLLAALMIRHAGIELVGHASEAGARRWTTTIVVACHVLAFGWGVVWAAALDGSLARGGSAGLAILSPTTVLVGLASVALCRMQGLAFLRLRVPAERTRTALLPTAVATTALALASAAVLTADAVGGAALGVVGILGLAVLGIALGGLLVAAVRGRDGLALVTVSAATAGGFAALLGALFPDPIAGAGPGAVSLASAASGTLTLEIMLAVAVVMLPLLLATLTFAYLRFLRRPDDAPSGGIGAVLARAARGTLKEVG